MAAFRWRSASVIRAVCASAAALAPANSALTRSSSPLSFSTGLSANFSNSAIRLLALSNAFCNSSNLLRNSGSIVSSNAAATAATAISSVSGSDRTIGIAAANGIRLESNSGERPFSDSLVGAALGAVLDSVLGAALDSAIGAELDTALGVAPFVALGAALFVALGSARIVP